MKYRRIGIIYNPASSAAQALARELSRDLADACQWRHTASEVEAAPDLAKDCDLFVTVGGDGTLLRAARISVARGVPVLGINMGKLGFMTELEGEDARSKLPSLLQRGGWLEERAMLHVEVSQDGRVWGAPQEALNDVVVSRAEVARIIYVSTRVDGTPLTEYKSDAVIVATATGSTGYALAAGGPILHPESKHMVLAPVSPHLCLDYPLVLSADAVVEMEVRADHRTSMSLDGQLTSDLDNGARLRVRRSPHVARFLRGRDPSYFFATLVQRLHPQPRNGEHGTRNA